MRYRTDLMAEILKSPAAQRIIDFVAPIYGESYTALWLYEVIGRVLDGVTEAAGSLMEQTVPPAATWSLPYWEAEYGTVPDPAWSIEQRRENIIGRIKYVPPVNPKKLAELASAAAGAPCTITENISKNVFAINIEGQAPSLERMFNVIEEAKPAHLIWQINSHGVKTETGVYAAGAQIGCFSQVTLPMLKP